MFSAAATRHKQQTWGRYTSERCFKFMPPASVSFHQSCPGFDGMHFIDNTSHQVLLSKEYFLWSSFHWFDKSFCLPPLLLMRIRCQFFPSWIPFEHSIFFFEITATYILVPLNQIEVTSETWTSVIPFGGIRSWWCNIRPSLRCPCTINWQFSLLAQLLFLSGASKPILLEVSALTECRLKQFSWAFGVGTPSPLTCLPIAGLFFLVPTTSKRLLRRLGHSIWACK